MSDGEDAILRVFAREGGEQLEALNGLLLQLETRPQDAELLAQLMRTAHNLKGASGTAGLGGISEAAHRFEDVLQLLRAGAVRPGPELFDALFAILDALAAALDEVLKGNEEPAALAAAIDRLERLQQDNERRRDRQPEKLQRFGFVLGEYDEIRIQAIAKRGQRLLRADFRLREDEPSATDKARELLRELRQVCEIVATVPAETELDRVEPSRQVAVLLGAGCPPEQLAGLLAAAGAVHVEVGDSEAAAAPPAEGPGAAPAAPAAVAAVAKLRGSVKVDVNRVDALVDMIGELVIAQSMVANAPEVGAITSRSVQNHLAQVTRITRELQDAGLRLRMVPLRSVFQTMARTVRDLARKHNKSVVFASTGEDVEMDRSVVERITDPLIHLVRNAVDHGVEPAEERVRRGKRAEATVTLSAFHQGGNIVVEVTDDGRGLDREKIREKAESLGLTREGAAPTDAEVTSFIFESGFSTAAEVTDTSGRGVGLDIVRRNVEAMRGRVTVSSQPGQGTRMLLVLPLTLAIIDGMLIGCGKERYIVPTLAIVESIRPTPDALSSVGGRWQLLNVRGTMLPLVPLADLFGVEAGCRDASVGLVVVVEGIGHKVGIVVDRVIAQQQVVIKSLGNGLGEAKHLSGAAILPDGSVGLILNIEEISSAGTAGAYEQSQIPDSHESDVQHASV